MAKQSINLGAAANDGTGDPLRTALAKSNDNFDELYKSLITGDPANDPNGYTIVAGVIRNEGSGWDVIGDFNPVTDTGHKEVNIPSVTSGSLSITINYGFTCKGIVSLVACPDETLAEFFTMGPSVGLSSATIDIRQAAGVGGYFSYNGSSFDVAGGVGVSSAVWSTDKLLITFESWLPSSIMAQATHRGGNYTAQAGGGGTNTIEVEFYDFAGTRITTPDTNMKVRVCVPGTGKKVNPSLITTASFPLGNIWILGLMRT